MAQMMSGFDIGADFASDNEKTIRDCIERIEALYEASAAGETIPPEKLANLKSKFAEAQTIVRQADLSLSRKVEIDDEQTKRREAIEARLAQVQREYQEALESKLSDSDVAEVKARLEAAYNATHQDQTAVLANMKQDLARKIEENKQLRDNLDELERQAKHSTTTNGVLSPSGKAVQQQIADFDVMKKSLMRDLQNRCERVVELEISLDETREQYNNVLRTSNNRQQQKKMAFLERNLEQLTHVQRQLVEQNSSLKKEVAIAERKLIARNDRILSLEALLGDSQEKLTAANHRYVQKEPNPYYSSILLSPSILLKYTLVLTQISHTDSKPNSQPSKSVSKPPSSALRAA
jgi:kinesin family protein 5